MPPLPIPPHPYFPFVLANGIDSIMLDYSGSMHCDSGHLHLEQHGGAVCSWQKFTHRTRYRRLVPLVQAPYRVMGHDGELFEVGGFSQKFDPMTGIMTTTVEACVLKLKITSLLDHDHVYAERFEVLRADSAHKPVMVFYLRRPRYHALTHQLLFPESYRISLAAKAGAVVEGGYSFDEIKGFAAMAVRGPRKAEPMPANSREEAGLIVRNLRTGDVLERFTSLQDNTHAKSARANARHAVGRACRDGFERVRREVAAFWKGFHRNTRVRLPDKQMQDQYRKSLYLIKSAQHPSGFVVEGRYGEFKGGGHTCYWDLTFIMRALVSSNQRDAAKALLDFYESTLPVAREYAAQLGRPGAYYPWFANYTGRSLNFDQASEKPHIQKWNNGCQAIQLFDPYRFWGDRDELARRLPMIHEIADFLLAEIVGRVGRGMGIRAVEGSDENIARVNDTAHLVTTIETLAQLVRGSGVLGLPLDKKYTRTLASLRKSLSGNYRDGVLHSWKNALRGPGNSAFTYHCLSLPHGIGARSLRAALRESRGEWGLTNPGTYRNLVWAWTEARAAAAFATINPGLTYERLKQALKVTSTHGIFPEKVRPDGFWVLFGYLTAHATWAWAANRMLAADDGKTLHIARGIPAEWRNLSFSDIHTASGFGVCFSLQNGRIRRLDIKNHYPVPRQIKLKALNPAFGKEAGSIRVNLKPGINHVI